MSRRALAATVAGVILFGAALLAVGFHLGNATARTAGRAADGTGTERRDFMFQVIDLPSRNQGGHPLNLYFHYRYTDGIAVADIPDYRELRKTAVAYLDTVDVSHNPYWETLNQHLCAQLKNSFPIEAITCELQVPGTDTPGPHYEPGYHASVETIGDIDPLAIPGPPAHP